MPEMIRIPIAKAVRKGSGDARQNLVFGWANVPYPVEKEAPDGSLEAEQEKVHNAFTQQFPGSEGGGWQHVMYTFGDAVIAAHYTSGGSNTYRRHEMTSDGDAITFDAGTEVTVEYVAKALVDEMPSPKTDLQNERVPLHELETAVYEFNLLSGLADVEHDEQVVGALVESLVITDEKLEALGVPEDARAGIPRGWWLGFRVDDDTMDRVENGSLAMFSIGGESAGILVSA